EKQLGFHNGTDRDFSDRHGLKAETNCWGSAIEISDACVRIEHAGWTHEPRTSYSPCSPRSNGSSRQAPKVRSKYPGGQPRASGGGTGLGCSPWTTTTTSTSISAIATGTRKFKMPSAPTCVCSLIVSIAICPFSLLISCLYNTGHVGLSDRF